jgi:hypothetical protein
MESDSAPASSRQPDRAEEDPDSPDEVLKVAGWSIFAGSMVMLAGLANLVYGTSAIDNAAYFEPKAHLAVIDLEAWGWIVLAVGLLQLAAAASIWAGRNFGRWVGIVSASVNCLVMLMFIPAYPFGALAVFGVDVLVIYGLALYGGRGERAI